MSVGLISSSIASLYTDKHWASSISGQLLYGEPIELLKQTENWIQVQAQSGEHGWIFSQQFMPISQSEYQKLSTEKATYSFDIFATGISANEHIPLVFGSRLPFFDGLSYSFNTQKIVYNGQVITTAEQVERSILKKIALKYLNSPQLVGGRTPFGIDPIGLVVMAYRFLGISLPINMNQLIHTGQSLTFIQELILGDLVFYQTPMGKQVALYLEDSTILLCDGKVRIANIDSQGIADMNQKKYVYTGLEFRRISL